MKFVKFGTVFEINDDPNMSVKEKWSIALRDPAYLIMVAFAIWFFGYVIYLWITL